MCVFFLLNVVGLNVYAHYCRGELASTSVLVAEKSCCAGDEENSTSNPDDCCKNEVKTIQIKDDFLSIAQAELAKLFPITLFAQPPAAWYFDSSAEKTVYITSTHSPPRRSCSIILLTQSFLI